jgi:O-antigen/teichoic acid export membrane protein
VGERALVFVATLLLARLLVPADFGVVAFALAVLHFLEYLADLGLGAALIYRSDARDPAVSSTAFWIGIVGAVALTAACYAGAPLLAEMNPDPRVLPLFRALSFQFLFTALGKTHEYRLRRSLEFGKLFVPILLGGLARGVISVALALAGAGAWSLIIGVLAGALTRSIALWTVHPWRPPLTISIPHVAPILRFGLGIVVVGFLGQAARNFDYVVVGGKLGTVALGFYYLAFRLPELVIASTFRIANEVLFPFYARLKEGNDHVSMNGLRDGYLQTVRFAASVALPAAFGMAALATPLVSVLYGERWRPSATPMAFIAIWAGIASLAMLPGAVFKALGRSWLLAATGIMQMAILFPAVWFAAEYGITAVAVSQVVVQTISLVLLGLIAGRILQIPWHAAFAAGARPLLLSAAMGAVLFSLARLLDPVLALAVCIPTGVACYALLLRLFMPGTFHALVGLAGAAARGRDRPVPSEQTFGSGTVAQP